MVLKLTLKEPYYSMTGNTGKLYELRRNTKWIRSRLYSKDGTIRYYTHVEFKNGYLSNSPSKINQYLGFSVIKENMCFKLPNGELYYMFKGDFLIYLA